MKRVLIIALILSISACESKNDCNKLDEQSVVTQTVYYTQPVPELPTPEYYASCQELVEDLTKQPTYGSYENNAGDTCEIPIFASLEGLGAPQADDALMREQPTNTQNSIDEVDRLKISDHYVFYANGNHIEALSRVHLTPVKTLQVAKDNEYLIGLFVYKNKLVVLSETSEPVSAQTRSANNKLQLFSTSVLPMNQKSKIQIFNVEDEITKVSEEILDGQIQFSRMSKEGDITLITNTIHYGSKKERTAILTEKFSGYECQRIQKPIHNYQTSITEVHNIDIKKQENLFGQREVLLGSFNIGYMDKHLYLSQNYSYDTRVVQLKKQENSWKQMAQGLVAGRPISSWSFFEKGNHLFVATTKRPHWLGQRENFFSVLKRTEDKLEHKWSLSIAPDEKLRSVRYTDEYAYLVTFRETDPLFIFDIKNPEKPLLKSELKVPGFSSYMHPVNQDTLLGVGLSENLNLQLSLFDVSKPEKPKAIEQLEIEGSSNSQYDHHAFYYNSTDSLLGLPLSSYKKYSQFYGATFYKLSEDGFTHLGHIDHTDLHRESCPRDKNSYASAINRIYNIDERTVSLSNIGIKVHDNSRPNETLSSFIFPSAQEICLDKSH